MNDKALREALEECKEALDSVWAAIGDALCSGNGIEKAYSNGVANEARRASDKARAALAANPPEQAAKVSVEAIRNAIITDQATGAGDYAEAEEYANKIIAQAKGDD